MTWQRCLLLTVLSAAALACGEERPRQSNSGPRSSGDVGTRSDASPTDTSLSDAAFPDGGADAGPIDQGVTDAGPLSCDGVACSGHGRCAIAGAELLCVCDGGYVAVGLTCVPPTNHAPVVVQATATPSQIGEGATVVIEAVVTDEDGAGDLSSGIIETPGGQLYAPLQAVRPGEWRATLSFQAILLVADPNFVESQQRILVVRLFDRAGASGTAQVSVTLACDAGEGVCGGGVCMAIDSAQNCWGCGATCPGFGQCSGTAQQPTCNYQGQSSLTESCSAYCRRVHGAGATCLGAEIEVNGSVLSQDCTQAPPSAVTLTYPLESIGCRCQGLLYWRDGVHCSTRCQQYGLTCDRTELNLTFTSQWGIYVPIECAPPYATHDPDALAIGDRVPVSYAPALQTCRCAAPRP